MFCIADDKNVVDIVDDICYSLIHHYINIDTNVIEIIFPLLNILISMFSNCVCVPMILCYLLRNLIQRDLYIIKSYIHLTTCYQLITIMY